MSRLITAVLMLISMSPLSQVQQGVPMLEVEACQIEFAGGALDHAKWGGQIAMYDVSAGPDGAVTRVERRVIAGREHLAKLMKLAPLEDCLRRWRFEQHGDYTVSLVGGTVIGPEWIIYVQSDRGRFRLRVPRRPTGANTRALACRSPT